MVVLKGINSDEITDFARKTITDDWNVRFIEHMPFTWAKMQGNELVSTQEIISIIRAQFGDSNRTFRKLGTALPNIQNTRRERHAGIHRRG